MAEERCRVMPPAVGVVALLFGVFLGSPASYAGGALVLVPEEDRDLPQGSQIPQHRIEKVEDRVRELKAKTRARKLEQQRKPLPQKESTKPEVRSIPKS